MLKVRKNRHSDWCVQLH